MAGEALGIIAGGGDLPRAIAESARDAGREVFVLALRGSANDWVSNFAARMGVARRSRQGVQGAGCRRRGRCCARGQARAAEILRDQARCQGDSAGAAHHGGRAKGDDALLRSIVEMFEREGFRVVGAAEAAPNLVAGAGPLGRIRRRPRMKTTSHWHSSGARVGPARCRSSCGGLRRSNACRLRPRREPTP